MCRTSIINSKNKNKNKDKTKQSGELPMFRTGGKILIYHLFFVKIAIFSFSRDIWRHNYITTWTSLLIEVYLVRKDQYLLVPKPSSYELWLRKYRDGGLGYRRGLIIIKIGILVTLRIYQFWTSPCNFR